MFKPLKLSRILKKFPDLAKSTLEAPLREAEQEEGFLWRAINGLAAGFVIAEKQRALFANRAALNFFEISEYADWKRPFAELIRDPEVREWARVNFLEAGQGYRDRLFFLSSRALFAVLELSSAEPDLRILTFLDITAAIDQIEDRSRSEKLESISKLISVVAHEIKNPLHSLGLHLQILEDELLRGEVMTEARKEEVRSNLDILKSETRRLNSITEQFIKFGQLKDRWRIPTDINRLIDSVIAVFQPQLIERGIEVTTRLEARMPKLMLQPERIYEVFFNIIKNALEALPSKGGRLSLETKERNGVCRIEIRDSGKGIPSEHLSRIFEPYFSGKKGGSGLGLAVVRETVENHGGSVRVSSRPGEGTVVTLLLPIKQEKPRLPRSAS